ncbi:flagellar basal-body MS-ring/collar protein FliF [Buchnera aphidicola]|uniref:flagellar basal-body MS-ring/collar protein FliF n=1 Tax=Buchnera aphidicola TaxID=9 RepID=UPI003463A834
MNVHFLNYSNIEKLNKNTIRNTSLWKYFMILFLVTLIFFSIILIFFYFSHHIKYQLIYNHLSTENRNMIIYELLKKKIPYRYVESSGNLLIPENKVNLVRLMLLSEGIPKKPNLGFELFDQESFVPNPFLSQIHYKRALEGELSRSLEQMKFIKSAKINLSFPSYSIFENKNILPSAAVMLSIKHSRHLNFLQFLSIEKFISASVPQLLTKNIIILDDKGHYLNEKKSFMNSSCMYQWNYIHNLQNYFCHKIMNVLKCFFQLSDFKIQVMIRNNKPLIMDFQRKTINFDKKDIFVRNILYKNINFLLNIHNSDIIHNIYYFILNLQKENIYNDIHDVNNHFLEKKKISVSILMNFLRNQDGKLVPLNDIQSNAIKILVAHIIGNVNTDTSNINIINMKFISKKNFQDTFFVKQLFQKYLHEMIFFLLLFIILIFIKFLKKIYRLFSIKQYKDINIVFNNKKENNNFFNKYGNDIKNNTVLKMQNDELIQHILSIAKKNPKLTSIIIKNWINNDQ